MKRKLLAVLIAAVFAAPVAYAQSTTPQKDTGMTKDRPAASGSASTGMKADTKSGTSASGSASTSTKSGSTAAKGDASAKGETKEAKKGDGKSPDAVITGKIKTGFVKDKIVRSRNYNVDTKDGVVTVKGKARTQAELDRALEIAKKTEGVKDVKNEVQLMAAADTKAGTGSSTKSGTSGSASSSSKSGASTSASGTAKADAKKDTSATTTSKGSTTTK